MTDPVVVVVEGRRLEGLESGSLTLTMNEGVNSFELTYVTPSLEGRAVFKGDEVEIRLADEVVLSGWAVEVSEEESDSELRVRVVGESKTCDLADCSAITPPTSWQNAGLDEIVADLCAPFGIGTFIDGAGKPFETFAVQRGEKVYETIARGALKRGLTVYTVGAELVLARAGQHRTKTVLDRGVNVVRASRTDSDKNRFSQYVFTGQARPTETTWGATSAHLKHIVTDPGVRRFRPLRITSEPSSGLDLEGRANLERNQRAGRGQVVTCTVRGLFTDEGYAWRPNLLVRFRSRVLGINATLIVTTARMRFGANDPRETELELLRPEAFDVAKFPALGRGEEWT